mgnify:CR=1 FL=1
MALKEAQKFTTEELEQIQSLQNEVQTTTFQAGQLHLSEIRLTQQKELLKLKLKELEEKESKLAQGLSDKYGKGSINVETGEFTPIEE